MASRFADSIGHYTTTAQAISKYGTGDATGMAITSAAGRVGGYGIVFTDAKGYLQRPLADEVSAVIGFAAKGTGPCKLLTLIDSATEQCSLWLRSDNKLEVRRGAAILGHGTAILSQTIHRWIEAKVTLDGSSGTFEVHVDGASDISLSSQNLLQTANVYATAYRFNEGAGSSSTISWTLGDNYHCDETGGVNDTFLGEGRLAPSFPTGTGTSAQFTPSAGANWQNVKEVTPDDDTTYNSDSTVGHADSFAMGDLPAAASGVAFVALTLYARRTDAGARTVQVNLWDGSTPASGAAISPSVGAYSFTQATFDTKPSGGAWGVSDVNGIEGGYSVAS